MNEINALTMKGADGPLVFAGLECEVAGSTGSERALVQIGVALGPTDFFAPPSGTPCSAVEDALVRRLETQGVPGQAIVAIGWGMSEIQPLVRRSLPAFSERFLSPYTIDLNSLCFALGGNKHYGDEPKSPEEWKATARWATELVAKIDYEIDPSWTDAGYRALTSWLAWRWFRAIIVDPSPATKDAQLALARCPPKAASS